MIASNRILTALQKGTGLKWTHRKGLYECRAYGIQVRFDDRIWMWPDGRPVNLTQFKGRNWQEKAAEDLTEYLLGRQDIPPTTHDLQLKVSEALAKHQSPWSLSPIAYGSGWNLIAHWDPGSLQPNFADVLDILVLELQPRRVKDLFSLLEVRVALTKNITSLSPTYEGDECSVYLPLHILRDVFWPPVK